MLGMLHESHYELTDNEYEADVIIVNTCHSSGDAKERASTILLRWQAEEDRKVQKADCHRLPCTAL